MNADKYATKVRGIFVRLSEDPDYSFSLDEYVDLAEEVLPFMDGSEGAKDLACDMVSLSGATTDTDGGIAGMGEEQKEWLQEWVLYTFGDMEISGEPTEEQSVIIFEEIEKYRKGKTATE